MSQVWADHLDLLIRARTPILWIRSREEDRLERLLEQRNDLKPQRLTNQIFVLSGVRFDPARLLLSGPGGQICKITRGDAALLNLLCLSPGIVLERDQLLQATGSLVDANTSSTIAIRISKLRKLLHVCKPGSGNLLESVRGRGYRLNGMVQRESSV